eukprot:CFRG1202T1
MMGSGGKSLTQPSSDGVTGDKNKTISKSKMSMNGTYDVQQDNSPVRKKVDTVQNGNGKTDSNRRKENLCEEARSTSSPTRTLQQCTRVHKRNHSLKTFPHNSSLIRSSSDENVQTSSSTDTSLLPSIVVHPNSKGSSNLEMSMEISTLGMDENDIEHASDGSLSGPGEIRDSLRSDIIRTASPIGCSYKPASTDYSTHQIPHISQTLQLQATPRASVTLSQSESQPQKQHWHVGEREPTLQSQRNAEYEKNRDATSFYTCHPSCPIPPSIDVPRSVNGNSASKVTRSNICSRVTDVKDEYLRSDIDENVGTSANLDVGMVGRDNQRIPKLLRIPTCNSKVVCTLESHTPMPTPSSPSLSSSLTPVTLPIFAERNWHKPSQFDDKDGNEGSEHIEPMSERVNRVIAQPSTSLRREAVVGNESLHASEVHDICVSDSKNEIAHVETSTDLKFIHGVLGPTSIALVDRVSVTDGDKVQFANSSCSQTVDIPLSKTGHTPRNQTPPPPPVSPSHTARDDVATPIIDVKRKVGRPRKHEKRMSTDSMSVMASEDVKASASPNVRANLGDRIVNYTSPKPPAALSSHVQEESGSILLLKRKRGRTRKSESNKSGADVLSNRTQRKRSVSGVSVENIVTVSRRRTSHRSIKDMLDSVRRNRSDAKESIVNVTTLEYKEHALQLKPRRKLTGGVVCKATTPAWEHNRDNRANASVVKRGRGRPKKSVSENESSSSGCVVETMKLNRSGRITRASLDISCKSYSKSSPESAQFSDGGHMFCSVRPKRSACLSDACVVDDIKRLGMGEMQSNTVMHLKSPVDLRKDPSTDNEVVVKGSMKKSPQHDADVGGVEDEVCTKGINGSPDVHVEYVDANMDVDTTDETLALDSVRTTDRMTETKIVLPISSVANGDYRNHGVTSDEIDSKVVRPRLGRPRTRQQFMKKHNTNNNDNQNSHKGMDIDGRDGKSIAFTPPTAVKDGINENFVRRATRRQSHTTVAHASLNTDTSHEKESSKDLKIDHGTTNMSEVSPNVIVDALHDKVVRRGRGRPRSRQPHSTKADMAVQNEKRQPLPLKDVKESHVAKRGTSKDDGELLRYLRPQRKAVGTMENRKENTPEDWISLKNNEIGGNVDKKVHTVSFNAENDNVVHKKRGRPRKQKPRPANVEKIIKENTGIRILNEQDIQTHNLRANVSTDKESCGKVVVSSNATTNAFESRPAESALAIVAPVSYTAQGKRVINPESKSVEQRTNVAHVATDTVRKMGTGANDEQTSTVVQTVGMAIVGAEKYACVEGEHTSRLLPTVSTKSADLTQRACAKGTEPQSLDTSLIVLNTAHEENPTGVNEEQTSIVIVDDFTDTASEEPRFGRNETITCANILPVVKTVSDEKYTDIYEEKTTISIRPINMETSDADKPVLLDFEPKSAIVPSVVIETVGNNQQFVQESERFDKPSLPVSLVADENVLGQVKQSYDEKNNQPLVSGRPSVINCSVEPPVDLTTNDEIVKERRSSRKRSATPRPAESTSGASEHTSITRLKPWTCALRAMEAVTRAVRTTNIDRQTQSTDEHQWVNMELNTDLLAHYSTLGQRRRKNRSTKRLTFPTHSNRTRDVSDMSVVKVVSMDKRNEGTCPTEKAPVWALDNVKRTCRGMVGGKNAKSISVQKPSSGIVAGTTCVSQIGAPAGSVSAHVTVPADGKSQNPKLTLKVTFNRANEGEQQVGPGMVSVSSCTNDFDIQDVQPSTNADLGIQESVTASSDGSKVVRESQPSPISSNTAMAKNVNDMKTVSRDSLNSRHYRRSRTTSDCLAEHLPKKRARPDCVSNKKVSRKGEKGGAKTSLASYFSNVPAHIANHELLEGEWYRVSTQLQSAALIFPYLPVVEVYIHSTQQNHTYGYGELISPAPKRIFIRCCCCGEFFGRSKWMQHAGNFTNRAANIKMVKNHTTIIDCFGKDFQDTLEYLTEHGTIVGTERASLSSKWLKPVTAEMDDRDKIVARGYTAKIHKIHSRPICQLPKKISTRPRSKDILVYEPKKSVAIKKKDKLKGRKREPTCEPHHELPQPTPDPPHELPQRVLWETFPTPVVCGNAMQQGYYFQGQRHSRIKVWKNEIEDMVLVHHSPMHRYLVAALADGHGGSQAAKFFVTETIRRVEQVLERGIVDGCKWDFSHPIHQRRFNLIIKSIYKALDDEYLDRKVEAFRRWKAQTLVTTSNSACSSVSDKISLKLSSIPIPQRNSNQSEQMSVSVASVRDTTTDKCDNSGDAYKGVLLATAPGTADSVRANKSENVMDCGPKVGAKCRVNGIDIDDDVDVTVGGGDIVHVGTVPNTDNSGQPTIDAEKLSKPVVIIPSPVIAHESAIVREGMDMAVGVDKKHSPTSSTLETSICTQKQQTQQHIQSHANINELPRSHCLLSPIIIEANKKNSSNSSRSSHDDEIVPSTTSPTAIDSDANQVQTSHNHQLLKDGVSHQSYITKCGERDTGRSDIQKSVATNPVCDSLCTDAVGDSVNDTRDSASPKAVNHDMNVKHIADPLDETLNDEEWVRQYLSRCVNITPTQVSVLVNLMDDAEANPSMAGKTVHTLSASVSATMDKSGAVGAVGVSPSKPAPLLECPKDDGCTLVVNIVYEGWIVNCNVGDSRSILLTRSHRDFKWSTKFSSVDQDFSNGKIVNHILDAGGEFIDDITGRVKIIRTQQNIYHGMKGCRVKPLYRISHNNLGVPTQRGINLGSTMGDLLFKLHRDNPIMPSIPDVSYIKVPDVGKEKALLFMMSDGLMNFLPGQLHKQSQQNDHIRDRIGYEYDIQLPLQSICRGLTEREELNRSEFDDCAIFALSFEQWAEASEPIAVHRPVVERPAGGILENSPGDSDGSASTDKTTT